MKVLRNLFDLSYETNGNPIQNLISRICWFKGMSNALSDFSQLLILFVEGNLIYFDVKMRKSQIKCR